MNQLWVVELSQHACHPQRRDNLESCISLQSLWQFFPCIIRLLETAKYLYVCILVQTNFGLIVITYYSSYIMFRNVVRGKVQILPWTEKYVAQVSTY